MASGFHQAVLTVPVSNRDHIQGATAATVTLVAYGDYQCSRCREAYDIITALQQPLPHHFVYRHFPQTHRHPYAQHAAEAAEAAGTQGQFWQMHALLLQRQQALDNGHLAEYALELGLDVTQFLREVSGHIHATKIQADYQSGIASGVHEAPTLFINNARYDGSINLTALMQAISNLR